MADTLIVSVGLALVAAGAYGITRQLPIIWVDDPAPEWWGMAAWALGIGFLICAVGLVLGLRGIGGFTALPATAGSLIGTMMAVVLAAKLIVREVHLIKALQCEVVVESVVPAARQNARKPYLVSTRVLRVVSGDVAPERIVFRMRRPDRVIAGAELALEYKQARRWPDLKTWFRRRVRDALEDAVSVSVQ